MRNNSSPLEKTIISIPVVGLDFFLTVIGIKNENGTQLTHEAGRGTDVLSMSAIDQFHYQVSS